MAETDDEAFYNNTEHHGSGPGCGNSIRSSRNNGKAIVDDDKGQNGLQQQYQVRTIDERRHSHVGQRIQGKVVQGLVPC